MNRLKGSQCYLSGAIENCSDAGTSWRKDITPFLKSLGIGVFDPTDKPLKGANESPQERQIIDSLIESGNYEGASKLMRRISNVDLRGVDKSDFIIVYMDNQINSAGTPHEITLSTQQKKPIIVMCPQGKKDVMSWWFGRIPHQLFFESWDEVKSYINHVNEDDVVDDLGRWIFIDYDKVFGG